MAKRNKKRPVRDEVEVEGGGRAVASTRRNVASGGNENVGGGGGVPEERERGGVPDGGASTTTTTMAGTAAAEDAAIATAVATANANGTKNNDNDDDVGRHQDRRRDRRRRLRLGGEPPTKSPLSFASRRLRRELVQFVLETTASFPLSPPAKKKTTTTETKAGKQRRDHGLQLVLPKLPTLAASASASADESESDEKARAAAAEAAVEGVAVGGSSLLSHWQVRMTAPIDSLYGGETYLVDIVFPKDYPMSPPDVRFVVDDEPDASSAKAKAKAGTAAPPEATAISTSTTDEGGEQEEGRGGRRRWKAPVHEHVYSNGIICMSLLASGGGTGGDWSPATTCLQLMLALQSMLSSSKAKQLPVDNDDFVERTGSKGERFDHKHARWDFHDDEC